MTDGLRQLTDQPVTLKQAMALDPGENVIELTAYNGLDLVASVPARQDHLDRHPAHGTAAAACAGGRYQ